MHIDRALAMKAFASYVEPYDPDNPRIALKVAHTYRVAEVAERVAASSGFSQEDVDLAWLCGLLHDVRQPCAPWRGRAVWAKGAPGCARLGT